MRKNTPGQRLHTRILTCSTGLCLSLTPIATAQTVLQFDDFESIGSGGISQDATFEAASGWSDVTSVYNATTVPIPNYNQNARTDVSGHDGAGGNAGRGMRVRSSTGAATLDNAMQLTTLGATSVTISYDINLDDDSAFTIGLYYADNADFTNAVEITTWTSDGTANGGWFSESWTLTDGAGGVTFSDDAWFMIGRLSRGSGANSTFHSFDNIEISYNGGGTDTTPPTVASTSPVDDAIDVTVDTDLVATFNEPIALTGNGTVTLRNLTLGAGSDVVIALPNAQVSVSGADLTINPTADLDLGTEYAVQISADAVQDLAGTPNAFAGILDDTTWSFTTPAPDTTAPTLDTFANNVSDGPIFEIQSVTYTVTFSEGMNNATVDASDFENASATGITIGSVTATGDPAVFTVQVSPSEPGAIQLQVKAGAILEDLAPSPNQLNTTAAITDPVIITVNAGAPAVLLFDDFESIGSGGISQDATFEAASGWSDVTSVYNATTVPIPNYNQNARTDVSGHDGAGGNAGRGMRVRSSTGAATLDTALPLASLGATLVTISYDINLDDDSAFTIGLYYADNADFTNAVEITTWTSDGTANGGWFSESWTLTDGAGGVTFSDDAWFMIGRLSRGSGANSTFHSFDNIKIELGGGGGTNDYDLWALDYPDADLTDPIADFDGDGLTNDNERLFGLDPTDPASSNPIVVPLDAAAGTLSFTRRDDALTGKFTGIETSTDLQMWTEDPGATLVVTGPDANGVETVAVTLSPGLLTAPTLFVRVVQDDGIILSKNFESGDGGFTFTATAGSDWAVGAPDSNSLGGSVAEGNGGSTNCFGTNLGAYSGGAGDPGYYDIPTTDSCLRSPLIDLSGLAGATLSFAEALDLDGADTAVVNILDATDMVIGTAVYTADDAATQTDADWSSVGPIDLTPYVGQSIKIEWCLTGGGTEYLGWYIDDVTVTETTN